MLIPFTVLWLCVYFPLETYASATGAGLLTFSYLIDLLGMVLMGAGVGADRQRRQIGPSLLAAGLAWTSANFWRGTQERFWADSVGMPLQFGRIELWLGPALTALAIVALFAALRSVGRLGVAKSRLRS